MVHAVKVRWGDQCEGTGEKTKQSTLQAKTLRKKINVLHISCIPLAVYCGVPLKPLPSTFVVCHHHSLLCAFVIDWYLRSLCKAYVDGLITDGMTWEIDKKILSNTLVHDMEVTGSLPLSTKRKH